MVIMERAIYLSELDTRDSIRIEQESIFFSHETERVFLLDDFYSIIDAIEED